MSSPQTLKAPEHPLLTEYLTHWAASRPHQRAFTHVEFPEPSSLGLHHTLGWQGLDVRARAIAGRIAASAGPGERAALLLPQGLDYTAAFLGCLYAGVIAVPLFSPELPGHEGRLAAVLADCEPACVLADAGTAAGVERFMAEQGLPPVPVVLVDRPSVDRPSVDRPGVDRHAETSAIALPERLEPDDIAYLQYTSGSTRSPAGVVISHANVVANARQAIEAFAADARSNTTVGWLPLFHDMGLVLSVAAPVVGGFPSVLMDPVAFLEHPVRWLRLLAAYPGTISAAPNFAYDYCASRIDRDEAAELRLDRVKVLINGSEPVRPGTVDRFRDAFADAGLAPEAHCPAYGLAEATVFVTTDTFTAPPTVLACDPLALSEGRLGLREPTDPEATHLVACGTPAGQELRIADPATGAALGPGKVGEIQLRGPNTGLCYWKRSGLSEEVFGFRPPDATAEDGEAGWLRTGDLGALHGGRLYVTGRLKDLIIVDGRNHYPQDIEETVQSAVDLVRRDRLAAFRVPWTGTETDVLVVVAEHRRGAEPTDQDLLAALRTATAAVSARHGLRLAELLLIAPGSLPRTSSGKVARAAGRARYLLGAFDEGGRGGAEGAR
ncbi:fatty acyl-AMP ligase [Streptomyces rectiviolaceus]|uniref:Fatty acyl-AMP ligase n=1 Tax=Streptomyces rectiviolaceus TaxID=332591 RepID=A0ABP6N1U7_9ACTN